MQHDNLGMSTYPVGRPGAAHAGRYKIMRFAFAVIAVRAFVDEL